VSTLASARRSGVTGRTYLERGRPVTVLIRWGAGGGPRNVLIRRANGQLTVRPFRGLRKPPPAAALPAARPGRAGEP
jgi:acetyl esterase